MLHIIGRAPQFAILAVLLVIPACSQSEDDTGPPETETAAETRRLFAQGFSEAREQPVQSAAPATSFQPDMAVRSKVAGGIADNLRRNFSLDFVIPDAEKFIRSGAASDIADRKLEALGLPLNDLASASVLMFGLAWEIANSEALTPVDQKALMRQVGEQLTAPREDEALQREADTRLMTAALWLEEARLRRGSPQRMLELSDAVQRDMMRLSGNDMRAHDIQKEGFVER